MDLTANFAHFSKFYLRKAEFSKNKEKRKAGNENVTEECKYALFSLRALVTQIKNLDPRFLAGAITIERSREENINSIQKNFGENLGFSDQMVSDLMIRFGRKFPEFIESPNDNQTDYENILVELYEVYYEYRKIFDKVFEMKMI